MKKEISHLLLNRFKCNRLVENNVQFEVIEITLSDILTDVIRNKIDRKWNQYVLQHQIKQNL